jgi:hypothetical protein
MLQNESSMTKDGYQGKGKIPASLIMIKLLYKCYYSGLIAEVINCKIFRAWTAEKGKQH